MFRFVIVASSLLVLTRAQMIPQCTCDEIGPCYETMSDTIGSCVDKCQNHFTAVGVSYPAARQCLQGKFALLAGTLTCAKNSFGDVCAAAPGPQVVKRYPETMQIAAFRELSGMLTQSGLSGEAAALAKVARKAVGCIAKCVRTQGCNGTKACGLALPSDNQIIATFKNCAMQSGLLTTDSVREMCGCLVNSGMPQLAGACPKIVIN